MAKKFVHLAMIAAVSLTSLASATPVFARCNGNNGYYENSGRDDYDSDGYAQSVRYDNRGYDNRGYGNRGYDNRNVDYRDNGDRGYDRSYDRGDQRYRGYKCNKGTTGTILGAVVGGLLGREVGRGGYNNRPSTTGLIIGAGAGALAGRAIERSGNRC